MDRSPYNERRILVYNFFRPRLPLGSGGVTIRAW